MNGREGRRRSDFYAILGLDKGCTPTELRNAYKSLAMRWHPDRCSASGNAKFVEEAKKKFQAIQQAYSVLSDEHKRFLYDVGVYDSDDEENNDGMGDFLDEMAAMMSQTKPSENGEESLEQLQELLDELIQGDLGTFSSCSSSHVTFGECSSASTRRSCSDMNSGEPGTGSSTFDPRCQSFCFGVERRGVPRRGKGIERGTAGGASSQRRNVSFLERNHRQPTICIYVSPGKV